MSAPNYMLKELENGGKNSSYSTEKIANIRVPSGKERSATQVHKSLGVTGNNLK